MEKTSVSNRVTNSTKIPYIIINILGGLAVSFLCIMGSYAQLRIIRSYAEAGLIEMISPLSFIGVLFFPIIGLCSLTFVILNLKEKIEIENKAE